MGPVEDVRMLYDRQDRSQGVAFVTYQFIDDAGAAIREFDGANAYGQPIRLSLLPPPAAPAPRSSRNPFDFVEKPSRSLFDRIESADDAPRRNERAPPRRRRSMSPNDRLAPRDIDRYAPRGMRDSRSPMPRRGGGGGAPRESGRRPGARREDSGRPRGRGGRAGGEEGRMARDGRPKKTAEELDAEMNDYWGGGSAPAQAENGGSEQREPQVATVQGGENQMTNTTSTINADDDIDIMVE